VPRRITHLTFQDRNVDDVSDGYVSCDSYNDNREWKHVEKMERGMQVKSTLFFNVNSWGYTSFFKGVPILVEGGSQTELKHPKNVYTQYEPRVFTEEEVDVIWNSNEMKNFLSKMDDVYEKTSLLLTVKHKLMILTHF